MYSALWLDRGDALETGLIEIYRERIPGPVEKAKQYVHENMTRDLRLADVAKECGVSKYHFSRIFKAITGRSLKCYINEKRIEKAKDLLMNTDLSVTEICYMIGFNDLSYFDRVFHRFVGTSPSRYRRCVAGNHTLRKRNI